MAFGAKSAHTLGGAYQTHLPQVPPTQPLPSPAHRATAFLTASAFLSFSQKLNLLAPMMFVLLMLYAL